MQCSEDEKQMLLELMGEHGASGCAIGKKAVGGIPTQETCVQFSVPRKTDNPPGKLVPKEIRGLKTDVLPSRLSLSGYSPTYSVIPPGCSIGMEEYVDGGSGTLGGIFVHTESGYIMGLTNYHCLAVPPTEGEEWPVGRFVIHPGNADNGDTSGRGRIGIGYGSFILGEYGDAGLFYLTKAHALSVVDTHVIYSGADYSSIDQVLTKRGRTTGTTTGRVFSIGWQTVYAYEEYGWGQIVVWATAIIPNGEDLHEQIAYKGDSGSIWYDPSTKKATALHFAHDASLDEFYLAYASNLPDVMSVFGINVISSATVDASAPASSFFLGEQKRLTAPASGFSVLGSQNPALMVRGNVIDDWSDPNNLSLEELFAQMGIQIL